MFEKVQRLNNSGQNIEWSPGKPMKSKREIFTLNSVGAALGKSVKS